MTETTKAVDKWGRTPKAGDLYLSGDRLIRCARTTADGAHWHVAAWAQLEILARGNPEDPTPDSFEPERDEQGRPVLQDRQLVRVSFNRENGEWWDTMIYSDGSRERRQRFDCCDCVGGRNPKCHVHGDGTPERKSVDVRYATGELPAVKDLVDVGGMKGTVRSLASNWGINVDLDRGYCDQFPIRATRLVARARATDATGKQPEETIGGYVCAGCGEILPVDGERYCKGCLPEPNDPWAINGAGLDRLARMLGFERNKGEPDAEFRDRVDREHGLEKLVPQSTYLAFDARVREIVSKEAPAAKVVTDWSAKPWGERAEARGFAELSCGDYRMTFSCAIHVVDVEAWERDTRREIESMRNALGSRVMGKAGQ